MSNRDERSGQISYRYRFGTAEFDEARFELRVAGLLVEVERRALEVLLHLLRHAGEVVTKDELLGEIWAGRVTVDKVLPNAINKLRRALGEANAELIVTQPRIGYRLAGSVERAVVGRVPRSRLELAPGQPVPERPNFVLVRLLGSRSGNEVWLAEHAKTHDLRVYKFADDEDRLRGLKREATLSRVLAESQDGEAHFTRVIDWNFESSPFFLECEYGGNNLLDWAKEHLAPLSEEQRVQIFLQLTDAVAAAHGMGVLHKDLKPANVLVAPQADGWQLRLTDFGSGRLTDPSRLEELGISRMGMTLTQQLGEDTLSGTPLYLAPETIAGHTPTAQSDVYALGVILYQLLAGALNKPLVPGWEEDVHDPLLQEDIRLATDGNPARRLNGAAELASRLRQRETRREHARATAEAHAQTQAAQEALTRSRARRPYLIALVVALITCTSVALWFYRAVQHELDRAIAINEFINSDLFQHNPVIARGQGALVKDMLLDMRNKLPQRFGDQPAIEADLRANFATVFNTMGLKAEAEEEERRALALYEQVYGANDKNTLTARSMLVRYYARHGKFGEALAQLNTFDSLAQGTTDPHTRYLRASAWGVYHLHRRESSKALAEFRTAIALLSQGVPYNQSDWDWLRIYEIMVLTRTGQAQEAQQKSERMLEEVAARGEGYVQRTSLVQTLRANAILQQDDAVGAQTQMLEAQSLVLPLLGPQHARRVAIVSSLAEIKRWQKDWPAAISYATEAHEKLRARYGDDYVDTDLQLTSLGQYLYESGRVTEAVPRLQTAHSQLLHRLGEENPATAEAGFWLAASRIALGELDVAQSWLRSANAQVLEQDTRGPAWQARLDVLQGLALKQRGDPNASASLRAALATLEQEEPSNLCNALCAQARVALGAGS
ncbi:MAG: winged helix-turn-helix domain-containing protein [Burkholderiaceae bacterium]|jgi:non-specific serine/threonine protein kinase|nr:winged helix-turn-helix domain-containing protein [Burkholderiaceae bacterium]